MHQNESFDDFNWFPDHPFSQPSKFITGTLQGEPVENASMLSISKSDDEETGRQNQRTIFPEISESEIAIRA